ncbi:heat-inducible transcription repressor HrcA, partial [Chlamydia psittaci 03DC29]
NF